MCSYGVLVSNLWRTREDQEGPIAARRKLVQSRARKAFALWKQIRKHCINAYM